MTCSNCKGTGIYSKAVAVGNPDFGKAFDCPHCEAGQARIQRKAARAFAGSGLPTRYADRTLADFDALDNARKAGKAIAISAAHLLVARFGQTFSAADIYAHAGYAATGIDVIPRWGAVLFGDYGTGKTSLAAAIANALPGRVVISARTIDLIKSVQAAYSGESGQSEAIIMQAIHADLLILDECNLTSYSPNALEIMERIIRRRYDNGRSLVLTANVDRDAFEAGWGVRIASCVNEMCHWVPVGGLPLRKEGAMLIDPSLSSR